MKLFHQKVFWIQRESALILRNIMHQTEPNSNIQVRSCLDLLLTVFNQEGNINIYYKGSPFHPSTNKGTVKSGDGVFIFINIFLVDIEREIVNKICIVQILLKEILTSTQWTLKSQLLQFSQNKQIIYGNNLGRLDSNCSTIRESLISKIENVLTKWLEEK